MIITIVAGARPNFMKIAPIIRAIHEAVEQGAHASYRLVHTGQHYDQKMSGDFFEQLGIPAPDVNLECGNGSQAEQTAAIMTRFEKDLLAFPPTVVLVVGDVTSTMACSITAKKLNIDVVHVEAGIRSGDMTMPEEINRIVTDAICDQFYTTSRAAGETLLKQNIDNSKIHFVGNTMIDSLLQHIDQARKPGVLNDQQIQEGNYFLLTLHRPSNVDDPQKLKAILEAITKSTGGITVLFPVHPRTRQVLDRMDMNRSQINMIDPQGYLEFIYLVQHAKAIITDSGGITEEATVLHIPCLTLRNSTERPETITEGTNELVGDDLGKLQKYLADILAGKWKKGAVPELWDGKTSGRIVQSLLSIYGQS